MNDTRFYNLKIIKDFKVSLETYFWSQLFGKWLLGLTVSIYSEKGYFISYKMISINRAKSVVHESWGKLSTKEVGAENFIYALSTV